MFLVILIAVVGSLLVVPVFGLVLFLTWRPAVSVPVVVSADRPAERPLDQADKVA